MANKSAYSILKKRSDFLNITKNGKRIRVCPWLILCFVRTEHSQLRIGWTLPSAVGSAVTRNRIKRYIRQNLRVRKFQGFPLNIDINLIFRADAGRTLKNLEHETLDEAFDNAFYKLASQSK